MIWMRKMCVGVINVHVCIWVYGMMLKKEKMMWEFMVFAAVLCNRGTFKPIYEINEERSCSTSVSNLKFIKC